MSELDDGAVTPYRKLYPLWSEAIALEAVERERARLREAVAGLDTGNAYYYFHDGDVRRYPVALIDRATVLALLDPTP
jgi:hypothetical protein